MNKTVRRVTADKKTQIYKLADILYPFLPMSTTSNSSVTFRSIFAKSKIEKYLLGSENKKLALQNGLEKLYRYHERLPATIIRKIIPASIEYRKYKRNPLTQKEINELGQCLFNLGIDMRKELAKIEINEELPRIQVPPERLKQNLRNHDLHPDISREPLSLFEDGHFNEAVRKACEKFENETRERSGLNKTGRDLMSKAFSDGSCLDISKINPKNQDDFVEGYKFLSMGAMGSLRNIFSHGNKESRSPEECYEMLLFLNWMFRYLK